MQVFRTPATTSYPRAPKAGVRKAPRHEIASAGSAGAVPRALIWPPADFSDFWRGTPSGKLQEKRDKGMKSCSCRIAHTIVC